MTIGTTKNSVLKVKGGKYVTVRQCKDGVKLCALDSQTEYLVDIYTQQIGGKNQMAFCFHHGSGGYFLEVGKKGINLKIASNSTPSVSSLCNEHWFERVEQTVGEPFGLRSVADSEQYLLFEERSTLIVCHSEMTENGLFTEHRGIHHQLSCIFYIP